LGGWEIAELEVQKEEELEAEAEKEIEETREIEEKVELCPECGSPRLMLDYRRGADLPGLRTRC